jgi:hypothetical protein
MTMSKRRADLGFTDPLGDFNPAEWEPALPEEIPNRPRPTESAKAAKAAGFISREPKPTNPSVDTSLNRAGAVTQRRRRTGRNAQFNLKAKPETIQAYCTIADAHGWGLGETLEKAVELLYREYGKI